MHPIHADYCRNMHFLFKFLFSFHFSKNALANMTMTQLQNTINTIVTSVFEFIESQILLYEYAAVLHRIVLTAWSAHASLALVRK